MLETLKNWLKTYSNWGQGEIFIDYLPAEPGNGGLYQKGLQVLGRREDLLGNVTVFCRWRFLLRLMAQEEESWLPDFQQWVQQQCVLGLAPRFGDAPDQERIQAVNGRLKEASQPGCRVYEVELAADFIKKYEEKNDGEN